MQPLAAALRLPCRRLTAASERLTPLQPCTTPSPPPPRAGEHAYAKVDGAHVWLDHYDARAGSGGVDLCGGPTPERRVRIPVTATVPHNARCALSPCTHNPFYIRATKQPHTVVHYLMPLRPLTPHRSPHSSVNISFGSTLQPAAGGTGCEASWAVDNVEVHTR